MWTANLLRWRNSPQRRAEPPCGAGAMSASGASGAALAALLAIGAGLAGAGTQNVQMRVQVQVQPQASAVTASAPQPGFDLVQLMRLLAEVKAGTARFVETRHVAMLERTLESSGRLSFEAPDRFTRDTLTPRRERFSVVGNTVTLLQGDRRRSLALDSVPEAAVMVEAIRGTLTGNRAALEANFSASVSGSPQRWTLDLVPRDWRLREQVTSVRVRGARAQVREVAVALADGDRSVMAIEPLIEPLPDSAASAPLR